MEKVPVKCPNCGRDFEVNANATRGKCPYCKISLIFENVVETGREQAVPKQDVMMKKKGILEEKVEISLIENAVDELPMDETSPKNISDIAAIESIEREHDYLSMEKKVDRILKSRG